MDIRDWEHKRLSLQTSRGSDERMVHALLGKEPIFFTEHDPDGELVDRTVPGGWAQCSQCGARLGSIVASGDHPLLALRLNDLMRCYGRFPYVGPHPRFRFYPPPKWRPDGHGVWHLPPHWAKFEAHGNRLFERGAHEVVSETPVCIRCSRCQVVQCLDPALWDWAPLLARADWRCQLLQCIYPVRGHPQSSRACQFR